MDNHEIGARIRKQREFLGMTREEFAEKINITPKFCSDIELGIKGFSVKTLCNISNVLMLTTDFLLFGKIDKKQNSGIENMLNNCSEEKIKYAEEILKNFILAVK